MTVLVVAEHRDGALRDVSYELVTAGRSLAEQRGTDLAVAVIGEDAASLAEELTHESVATVYAAHADSAYNHGVYTQVIERLHGEVEPDVLLMPHTVNGLDYAPAVAEGLDLPFVTDVTAIERPEPLTVARGRYGGKVVATYELTETPLALSLRPAEWPASEADGGNATIEAFDPAIDADAIGVEVTGYEAVAGGEIDITDAEVLVSIGRGIDEEENLPLVEALADAVDGVVSASRPIVDNGWLPRDRQVGQSGKTVTPEVYIAIGISGAVQHVSGMKGSETIIAINNDPNAPIFDIADYGIVGDLFEVVPALIEEFGGENPL